MKSLPIVPKALAALLPALSLLLMSCGMSTEFYKNVEMDMAKGNHLAAIQQVRENQKVYGDKATVLYNLDVGTLFHYAGMADSSNRYLFAAEKEIDDLFTKSISLRALSFILNDNVIPYDGEDFEKVMVNILLAMNFAQKGQMDEALVEARKVDLKLREYSKQYDGKNKYQEDAFIRYITGVLYEAGGEINDAFIAYRKAYETYQVYKKEYGTPAPSFLLDDLVRTATLMAFTEEAGKYKALGGRPYKKSKSPEGTVLVVVYSGRGPIKEEVRPTVSIPDSSGKLHTFQIALPKFVPRLRAARNYSILARAGRDTTQARAELAQDITAIASKTLDDRLALIYLKSGGRAIAKFLASEKAKAEIAKDSDSKLRNLLGSIVVDLAVGATEQADVRTWRTLPAEIQLARLRVPAGEYALEVSSSDGQFSAREPKVVVRAGTSSFVVMDDVR